MVISMNIVSKSLLKAKMLEYFKLVERTGKELVITSNGKPVLKVIPYREKESPIIIFKKFRGKIKYLADLLEDTSLEWSEM